MITETQKNDDKMDRLDNKLWGILDDLDLLAKKDSLTGSDFQKLKVFQTQIKVTGQLRAQMQTRAYLEKIGIVRERLKLMFPESGQLT